MAGDKHPEWLPNDWKVGGRKKGGRKLKWYIAPENGMKFFSKAEVLQYIEEVNAQQQQNAVQHDQVIIERRDIQKLPEGWIKKVKTRKTSKRTDPVYIEPVTRREFRSMVSVLRYLKLKAVDGDKDHIGSAEDDHAQYSPTEVDGETLIENQGGEELAEENIAKPDYFLSELDLPTWPSPANNGAESSTQQNEQKDTFIEDYVIETSIYFRGIDFQVESPREEVYIHMDQSHETPAAGSSSELSPGDFISVPWFLPAYQLIKDEISVATYLQQTSTNLG